MTKSASKVPRRRPDTELLTAGRILRQLWALSPDARERVFDYMGMRMYALPDARPLDGGEPIWSRREGPERAPPWVKAAE